MECNPIAAVLLITLVSLEIGNAEIVTKPTITEVVVGGSTYLNCSTNSSHEIHWFHVPLGSNEQRKIVYGHSQFHAPYVGRFQMEKNEASGAYNLVIPSAKLEDAGAYECPDENGQGKKESSQLIVLESDPVCEPHFDEHTIVAPNNCGIEPTELVLNCSVAFRGNEAPIMEWRSSSDNMLVSERVTHVIIDSKKVVYSLTIKGNSTVKEGGSYFCNATRSVTRSVGCKSGKSNIRGTVVDCPPINDSAEICQTQTIAMICIAVLIVIIIATVLACWCLCRRKRRLRKTKRVPAPEEINLTSSASSQEINAQNSNETNETNVRRINIPQELNSEKDIKIVTLEKEYVRKIQETSDEIEKLKVKCKTLEKEYVRKIQEKSDEIERLKNKYKATDSEIRQLKAKVKELEQYLYPEANIDYAMKPTSVRKILTDAEAKERRKPINGMTILKKELFVLHENNSTIEVYDLETFKLERKWEIKEMSDPLDIASCKVINCIYVINRDSNEAQSKIMKFEPTEELITKWSTGGDRGRLSTYESNVIVCLFEKQLIIEFTRDGDLIQSVSLAFNHPSHAIKVTSTHFAVCHGDTKDELHRVCIVDATGNIIKELIQGKWNRLNVPICLVEDSERAILVADRDNRKIRLLNSVLKCERSLVKLDFGTDQCPVRMCLDETERRLLVAANTFGKNKKEWKNGTILIFNKIL